MNNIAKYIDHTLLKPDATKEQIKQICDEAKKHGFQSVCVNPSRVEFVSKQLAGSEVLTCCVIGFPLGATLSSVKAFEAASVIELGASEIDMVMNIGAAKDGNWDLVESDIKSVVDAVNGKAIVKVIIETCLLTDAEKELSCKCAMAAGADYVKTSTGFSSGGATIKDVALMHSIVGSNMGVKASGGISTNEAAEKLIAAGASRLGTSNGVRLLNH